MRRLVIVLTVLTTFGFGYVLLSEDFNSAWTTNSPPTGWRIFHTNVGLEGTDDWHPEEPGTAAWPSRDSRYCAIFWNIAEDAPPDSLVTPVIDCSGYKNVRLRVTTRFGHKDLNRYFAQIWYSLDGGATFTHQVEDYEFLTVDSTEEVFSLSGATDQSQVVLAWVFDSTLQNIWWWCIDDVSVEGESIPDNDIECSRILSPGYSMIPGDVTPEARFTNLGALDQTNIPIACVLLDDIGDTVQTWYDTIPSLMGGGQQVDWTFAPPEPVVLGDYQIWFWSSLASDEDRSNDTLYRNFSVTYAERRYYDFGSGHNYEDWPVGHYGWGAKFGAEYPVFLESLQVYLRCPSSPFNRYQLAVVQNSSGVPGEMLYKTPVLEGVDGWNSLYVPADSNHLHFQPNDSFFVFYLQVGETQECPELDRDNRSRPSYAEYWQYHAGTYVPDTGPGNYRIRCWINKETIPALPQDLRTLYVDEPWYEFIQRPHDAPFVPKALIDNNGTGTVPDVVVRCSIFGLGNVLRYSAEVNLASLGPYETSLIEFDTFVPPVAEQCSIIVHATPGVGGAPEPMVNDAKRFGFDVIKGAHTGMSSGADYAWVDSDTTGGPVFDWVDTSNADVAIAIGDELRIFVPIGFEFPFGDTTYQYCYVCTNGWLALGDDQDTNDSLPKPLPEASAPNRCLYPWWDNLAVGAGYGGGMIFFKVIGSSPNRRFVVIWKNAWRVREDGDTTDLITFEAILHENGTVTYQYLDTDAGDPTYDNARYACIGLEDDLGADGLCYLYSRPPMSNAVNDLENRVRDGTAIRLYPIFKDAAALDIVCPLDYTFPGSVTPVAKIQNYGTVLDSIIVFMKIRDPIPPYEDTVTVYDLLPGDSTTVAFKPWMAELGYYTVTCSTVMIGDAVDSNDVFSKIIAVSPWIQRDDIPIGNRRRKVKGAALCYNPDKAEVYALKGGNENTVWVFDLASGEWDSLTSMPENPSGRRAKYGCDLAYDPDHGTEGRLWATKGGGKTDFYYYDIAANLWVERKPVYLRVFDYRPPKKGAAIDYAPSVGLDGSVYAILGNNTNLFWRYDIATDTWLTAPDIPTNPFLPGQSRFKRAKHGADLMYGDGRIYCIKGNNSYEVYGYDPITNAWTDTLTDTTLITDRRHKKVKAGGSGCYLDSTIYLLKGGNTQQFWRYEITDQIGESLHVWEQLTDIPLAMYGRRRKVKRGSALEGIDSTVMCLKGSYTYEFWEYKPGGDSVDGFFGIRPSRQGVMDAGRLATTGQLLAAYPNPTRSGVFVRYTLSTASHTRLSVYDQGGRLVRTLSDSPCLPGRHIIRWDGTDNARRRVPAGVYFVKLESGAATTARKLILRD